jgi:hypothetical protein
MPTGNTVLASVLVAEIHQERTKLKAFFEGLNDDGDIEDWFSLDAGDGRAPGMLNIKCGHAKRSSDAVALGGKARPPLRSDFDETKLAGDQTKVSVVIAIHEVASQCVRDRPLDPGERQGRCRLIHAANC